MEGAEWLRLVPLFGTLGAVIVITVMQLRRKAGGKVNQSIEKGKDKVVHAFDIEDLADKVAFCRCWRSGKFPYCDGSHTGHNKLTGDNVGPLCLSRRSASAS